MSIFDGLGEAPIFGRGNYLNPGAYDVQILRVFPLDTRASGLATIGELDVKTSAFKPQEDPLGKGRVWQPTPANVQGSWYQDMSDRSIALPAIKEFLIGCLGLRTGDPRLEQWLGYIQGSERWPTNRTGRPLAIITNMMDHVVSDANAFQGLFVHVDCTMIKTKKGADFTRYDWKPLDFQTLGIQPPNLDRFLVLAMSPAPPVNPQQAGQAQSPAPAAQGWGQPPAFGQGYGPPQGPPPAQNWAPSPQGQPYGTPAQGWGQPPTAAPPVQGPPPGWGQPQAQTAPPAAQGWPPSQAAPPNFGTPPGWGQPPAAKPVWTLPAGGHYSPDRKSYWAPGMANWAPIPSDDIPF